MAKARRAGQRAKAREADVWTDGDGRKRVQGVRGNLSRADLMLGGRLLELVEFSHHDLTELANTLRDFALSRELVRIRERLAALEKGTRARGRRAA